MRSLRNIFGMSHRDEDDKEQFCDIPAFLKSELVSNGCDKLDNGKGEFGKCLGNPIPVNGPNGELKYLSMLSPSLAFHRLGSIKSKDLKRAVDVYEIVTRDGSKWDVFYFDMYHTRRSRIAPKGFSLGDYHKIFGKPLFAIGTNDFDKTFPHGIPEIMKQRIGGSLGEKIYSKVIPMDIVNRDFRRPKDHFNRIQNVLKEIQGQTDANAPNADDIYVRSFYASNGGICWGVVLLDEVLSKLKNIEGIVVSDVQRDLLAKEVFMNRVSPQILTLSTPLDILPAWLAP